MLKLAALSFCIMSAMPAYAQTDRPADLPEASSSDDVIVQGLRIPREKLPTGVYWNYASMLASRITRENSEMFLRCALRSGDTAWLRKVVDGEPNSATSRFAQGWIVETHRGCYPPTRLAGSVAGRDAMGVASYGESRVDRGVLIESALKTYAPDAELTPAMTDDPAVKRRFRTREGVRNRLRLDDDRDALVLTSCLVEHQPVLATRIVRSAPGSALERGLTQALIVQARACIGGTRRVTIDPTLARIYVVDAFYRWVVAARDVDSLIPADA